MEPAPRLAERNSKIHQSHTQPASKSCYTLKIKSRYHPIFLCSDEKADWVPDGKLGSVDANAASIGSKHVLVANIRRLITIPGT